MNAVQNILLYDNVYVHKQYLLQYLFSSLELSLFYLKIMCSSTLFSQNALESPSVPVWKTQLRSMPHKLCICGI